MKIIKKLSGVLLISVAVVLCSLAYEANVVTLNNINGRSIENKISIGNLRGAIRGLDHRTAQIMNNGAFKLATFDKALDSAVTVMVDGGLGSGFYIHPNYILTNNHVAEGMLDGTSIILNEHGRMGVAKVVFTLAEKDVAVLYTDDLPSDTYLELGHSLALRKGSPVFSVSSPYGQHNTLGIGYVSNIISISLLPKLAVLQVTTGVAPGSSGGCLLSPGGEVVGIIFAAAYGADNIGFAIPVDEFSSYVKGAIILHQKVVNND